MRRKGAKEREEKNWIFALLCAFAAHF